VIIQKLPAAILSDINTVDSLLIGKKKAGKTDLACPRVRALDGITTGIIHPYRSADKTLEEQRFSCFCLSAGSYIHTGFS